MKALLIILAIALIRAEEPIEERKLSQIKVEVEDSKADNPKPRKLRQKSKAVFFKKVKEMADKYSLDKDIDPKESDRFFKRLENRVYNDMKQALFRQREYVQSYNTVIEEYKRLVNKYGK